MQNIIQDRLSNTSLMGYHVALLAIAWIGMSYCLINLLFFLNISLDFTKSCCIACITIFSVGIVSYRFYIELWMESVLTFMLFVIGMYVASFFYDFSYDGQMYHGEAMIKIREGWNPIVQHFEERQVLDYVYNHFAKAGWIIGGFLYGLSDNYNSLKGINIVWMVCVFLTYYHFLKTYYLNPMTALIFSLLIAINPIFLNMYLSNMIDLQLCSSVYILLILTAYYYKNRQDFLLFIIALTIIYLVNLKITALIYVIVFYIGFVVYLLLKREVRNFKKLLLISIIALSSAVLIFGNHTYVKNYTMHNHIFYPMYGDKDAILSKSPMVDAYEYKTGNRVVNIAKSHFASTTFSDAYSKPLRYKWPFAVSRYELERYAFAGVMIGGFGVWFSAIMLLSYIVLIYYFIARKGIQPLKWPLAILIGTILISVFINPLWYIARYVPQYYLIPILALFVAYHFKNRFVYYVLLIFLIVNSSFIMGYTYYNAIVRQKINSQIVTIKQNPNNKILVNFKDHRANRAIFQENGIQFNEVVHFSDSNHVDTLFRSNVVYEILHED